MALLLAAIIGIVPLWIAPGLFFYFDVTPKTVLLLVGTAAAMLASTATGGAPGFHRSSRFARWFVFALIGLGISLALSTLASVNRPLSIGGSNWRYWGLPEQLAGLVLAYLVAACCAGDRERLRLLLRSIAASGLVIALYGIAQYFGWDPFQPSQGYHAGEGVFTIVRPPSTLGHADYFGNWVVGAVFSAIALRRIESSHLWRWVATGAAVTGTIAILLSGTRAAMIGVLAAGILLALWDGPRVTRRVAAGCGVGLLVLVAFYWSPAGTLLRARVHWSLEEPAGGARLLLWRDSVRMAGSRLALGYGPETFISSFALHQSADLAHAYPDFYHESPHNIFLDALVSQGIPGLVLSVAIVALGLAAAWQMRREAVGQALGAGLAGMTISQQFACFMLPTGLAWYVAVAMLVSLTCVSPAKPRGRAQRWPWIAATVPFVALFAVIGIRLSVADTALAKVERDLNSGNVGDAANRYSFYDSWRLPGASADLWYSRRLVQVGQPSAEPAIRVQAFQYAWTAARRAPSRVEDPFNAYYNLAAFYARFNDIQRTEQSLRQAIALAPNWFKPHWMLAQVLDAVRRLPEAETEAATAVSLDAGKNPEVRSTLDHIRTEARVAASQSPHK